MLRLIIKGDVSGSVEAVAGAVEGIGNNLAGVKIVHQGVGNITESDVQLAQSSQGVIVAFNVNVPRPVEQAAGAAGVPITSSGIIYQLMGAVTTRVIDLLPKIKETRVLGEASVLQMFDIQLKQKQVMRVAGCRVVNGLVEKEKTARVVRGGETIFTGPLDTLRHLKKDVSEIRKGSECGLSITGFSDFREGDLVQVIQEVEKPGQL